MERLGKINKVNMFYLHWDNPKRDFYLDWLPDKIYVLFIIADDENREDDYLKMAEFFTDKNVFEVYFVGKDEVTAYNVYRETKFKSEEEKGRGYPHPDFLKDAACTSTDDNFDWGFWMTTRISQYHTIDEIICVDFTHRRVKKYLKMITKVCRKEWGPRGDLIDVIKEPLYDDEIKKPLRKSQKGFEKD